MANNQTLPSLTRARPTNINTNGNPLMPKIRVESPLRQIGGVVDTVNKFTQEYADIKNQGYAMEATGLMQNMAHEMEDATDPCDLTRISQAYDEKINNIGGDDFWAKGFRNSLAFKKMQNNFALNKEKLLLQGTHKFTEIEQSSNADRLANALASSRSPADINDSLMQFNRDLGATQHLTAEAKLKIMQKAMNGTLGNVIANNPEVAKNFTDTYGEYWGKYGLDTTDVISKSDTRIKALREEARQEEKRQKEIIKEARKAQENSLKAQIIANPEKTDSILAYSSTLDDETFVNLSEFARKRKGKGNAIRYEDIISAVKKIKDGDDKLSVQSEYNFSPSENTVLNDALKEDKPEKATEKVKEELADLDTKEKAKKWFNNPSNEIRALVYASEPAKKVAEKYGIDYSKNSDNDYSLRIAEAENSDTIDTIKKDIKADNDLTNKDKGKYIKEANKRKEGIAKGIKTETKEREKLTKESLKRKSEEAMSNIIPSYTSSEETISALRKYGKDLTPADRNKVLAKIVDLQKDEGKREQLDQKQLIKDLQSQNYFDLNNRILQDDLTQDEIDTARDNKLISNEDAVKLTNKLKKENEKKDREHEKLYEKTLKEDKNESMKMIAKADYNNELVDIENLPSDDAEVIKYAKQVNNKNAKAQYAKVKNEIYEEIAKNPEPDFDTTQEWKTRLGSVSYYGNTENTNSWVDNAVNTLSNIESNKRNQILKSFDDAWGSPIKDGKFSPLELQARAVAKEQILDNFRQNPNNPTKWNIQEIVDANRVTKEDLFNYNQNEFNAIYVAQEQRDSLFNKVTTSEKDDDTGETISSISYKLKDGVTPQQYVDYEQGIKENYKNGRYTSKQYSELMKPVVMNRSYIMNNLANRNNTVEEKVANKLKAKYGNIIQNPEVFTSDFYNIIDGLKTKGYDVKDTTHIWWGTLSDRNVQEAVDTYWKSKSAQIQGSVNINSKK